MLVVWEVSSLFGNKIPRKLKEPRWHSTTMNHAKCGTWTTRGMFYFMSCSCSRRLPHYSNHSKWWGLRLRDVGKKDLCHSELSKATVMRRQEVWITGSTLIYTICAPWMLKLCYPFPMTEFRHRHRSALCLCNCFVLLCNTSNCSFVYQPPRCD